MSIHLVGGGWSTKAAAEVYGPFLVESAARAAGSGRMVPRVGVLLHGTDAQARDAHDRYPVALALVGGGPTPDTALVVGESLRMVRVGSEWQVAEGLDGIAVGTLAA